MRKPEGAMNFGEARTAKGPWYVVYSNGGHLLKRRLCPAGWFFKYAGTRKFKQIGFTFDNYFHAYAYSLKCKERARVDHTRQTR